MEKTDEELTAEYAAGNEDAFASLLRRHLKSVYSFALRSAGEDAQDLTQDIFLKAWENLGHYDSRKATFRTWLMHIARNTVIDHLRKKRPLLFSDLANEQDENPTLQLADPEPLPDELVARAQDARDVQEVLSRLTPSYLEVILLRYMSHMTFEEISAVLEEPFNTVRSRHHRALIQLRRHLETLHQKGE